jgi:hypothetical protein
MGMATCHTPDCINAGIALDVGPATFEMDGETWPRGPVTCGVCGQPITDITEDDE